MRERKIAIPFGLRLRTVLLVPVVVACLLPIMYKWFKIRETVARRNHLDACISMVESVGAELSYGGSRKSTPLVRNFEWLFGYKTLKPRSIQNLPAKYMIENSAAFMEMASELVEIEVVGVIRDRASLRMVPKSVRLADLSISQDLLTELNRLQELELLRLEVTPPLNSPMAPVPHENLGSLHMSKKLAILTLTGPGVTDDVVELFRDVPNLYSLSIDSDNFLGAGLACWKQTSGIQYLRLRGSFDDDSIMRFSPFPSLEGVDIISDSVRGDGLKWLSTCKSLTSVRMSGDMFDDTAIKQLRWLLDLEEIFVYKTKISGLDFGSLTGLERLRTIDIRQSPIDQRGLRAMAGLGRLERLYLENTNIDVDDILYFKGFSSLRHLEIEGLPVRDNDLAVLNCPPKLLSLELHGSEVSAEGVRLFNERYPDVQLRIPELFREQMKQLRGY